MDQASQLSKAELEQDLLSQQAEIKAQLKSLDEDDPVMLTIPVAIESGTEAWEADVHVKSVALKGQLLNLSKQISETISRIHKGSYGRCTKCMKGIEVERLKVMPTAALCLACVVTVK